MGITKRYQSFEIEEREGEHKFIHTFDPPKGIVCSHFPVLSWANGCAYTCAYCYLFLTLRMQKRITVWTNYYKMEAQIKAWMKKAPKGAYLNAGELADSLGLLEYSLFMLETVLPTIEGTDFGLYTLTKSNGSILKNFKPMNNVVVGFSVNANKVARAYETDAPLPWERLNGAEELKELGWRIRIRLDPMLPINGWKDHYWDIIQRINELEPEKVTIGSLRFNPLLPRFCPPSDIWDYASEREAGNKLRVDEKTTAEMYQFALDNLKHGTVALCKESPALWKKLRMGRLDCVCL